MAASLPEGQPLADNLSDGVASVFGVRADVLRPPSLFCLLRPLCTGEYVRTVDFVNCHVRCNPARWHFYFVATDADLKILSFGARYRAYAGHRGDKWNVFFVLYLVEKFFLGGVDIHTHFKEVFRLYRHRITPTP